MSNNEKPIFKDLADYPDQPMVKKLIEDIDFYSETLKVPTEIINNLVCRAYALGKVAAMTQTADKMRAFTNMKES